MHNFEQMLQNFSLDFYRFCTDGLPSQMTWSSRLLVTFPLDNHPQVQYRALECEK